MLLSVACQLRASTAVGRASRRHPAHRGGRISLGRAAAGDTAAGLRHEPAILRGCGRDHREESSGDDGQASHLVVIACGAPLYNAVARPVPPSACQTFPSVLACSAIISPSRRSARSPAPPGAIMEEFFHYFFGGPGPCGGGCVREFLGLGAGANSLGKENL